MTISSQDYAALSNDAYKDRAVGRRALGQEETVTLNGHAYNILEQVDNRRTGYQGTVYQRRDTNEIVVAHRGTEQIFLDGVVTDGAMVIARSNPQAADALALTERALIMARREGADTGHTPEVSVTGHSLGGALAQISAHHHGLRGETFNAYGTASLLSYRIPEGGDQIINHVMAADPVSAASPHYGQVRIYATPGEIRTLEQTGFSNNWYNFLERDYPIVAAAQSLGSHKLGNFLEAGSVLDSPGSRRLADDNKRMIEEYRDDVHDRRMGLTLLFRNDPGGAVDIIDSIRGPLPPGEPARREAEQRERDHTRLRIDDAAHPGHALFTDAQRGVHAHDARVGRAPDHFSDQLAGSLAAQMHAAGGQRIDLVRMSEDASRTFAVQGKVDDPAHLRVSVDTTVAINTGLEQSSRAVEERAANARQDQDRSQHQVPGAGRNMSA